MATERELDRRPDPDALLALAGKEGRGKLKVFLGAAPGVGKTYAMLPARERLKAEGLDVVIGLVETHGRAETAALLEGHGNPAAQKDRLSRARTGGIRHRRGAEARGPR